MSTVAKVSRISWRAPNGKGASNTMLWKGDPPQEASALTSPSRRWRHLQMLLKRGANARI